MPPISHQNAFNHLKDYCGDFSEAHKQFLQVLMKRRHINVEEIGDIFQQICKEIDEDYQRKLRGLEKIDKDENLQIMQILLNMLNPAVNALGLHIVQLADEYYRSMDYWVLVSELHFSTAHLHSGTLNKEEIAMFHSWLKLMFREYQQTERDGHDSAAEKIFDPNEGHYKTAGELNLSKALIYAKAKGWTMARAQLLLKKMCQQGWIRRIEGFDQKRHNKSRSKRMSSMDLENANIRLNPCAVAELEPLLNKLHVPNCVICKHPVVVSRLAHTCEDCKAFYHGSCMLRVLEFPAKCLGPNCSTMMEAECLEDFVFTPDKLYLPSRRSGNALNTSNEASTSSASTSSRSAKPSAPQPFASLREF